MILRKITRLTVLLLKEQFKEPSAFLWVLASPAALFYFKVSANEDLLRQPDEYLTYASWFYGYIALTLALFGFAFYLVGRRESGFTRCFIFHAHAQRIYLSAHFCAHSAVTLMYGLLFYLITKPAYGTYVFTEALGISARFYMCFALFMGPAALLSLLPVRFQTANILFSSILLAAFITSLTSAGASDLHPLSLTRRIFQQGLYASSGIIVISAGVNAGACLLLLRFFPMNPAWQRY